MKAALAGALLFGANIGWATNTACSGTYNLAADSTGLVSGGSFSGGCEKTDSNFTSFSFTPGTGPMGSSISVGFFGAFVGNTGDPSAQFTGNWTNSMTTIIGETATIDNANSTNLPPAGTLYEYTSLSLGNIGESGSGSVLVFEEFCLGSATFNCTSTSGNYGYIQLGSAGEFTCLNGGASSCVVTTGVPPSGNTVNFTSYLPGGTPVIAIQTTVTISGSESLESYDNFVNFTAETPEPATFGLMVFALCGFGLLFKFTKPATPRG